MIQDSLNQMLLIGAAGARTSAGYQRAAKIRGLNKDIKHIDKNIGAIEGSLDKKETELGFGADTGTGAQISQGMKDEAYKKTVEKLGIDDPKAIKEELQKQLFELDPTKKNLEKIKGKSIEEASEEVFDEELQREADDVQEQLRQEEEREYIKSARKREAEKMARQGVTMAYLKDRIESLGLQKSALATRRQILDKSGVTMDRVLRNQYDFTNTKGGKK